MAGRVRRWMGRLMVVLPGLAACGRMLAARARRSLQRAWRFHGGFCSGFWATAPAGGILGPMLYRFGTFELDTAKAELRADGAPRPVEPQVFALLALLVENRERLVSRDEIHREGLGRARRVRCGARQPDQVGAAGARRRRPGAALHPDDPRPGLPLRRGGEGRAERYSSPTRRRSSCTPDSTTAQPARPSIAVLPFRLIGDAGPYAAIADALPHELITELSRLRWLFVTARGSSFRLRAADADMREIGRVLGVRYCLSGTVEVAGPNLVVTVELVDTRDGGVVWADRFAGAIDDVHAIREDIRARILDGARAADPAARSDPRPPHGDREPRCLVGVSPRPAAHVPLQPHGQCRGHGAVPAGRRAGSGLCARARGAVVRALPDGVHAAHGRRRRRSPTWHVASRSAAWNSTRSTRS